MRFAEKSRISFTSFGISRFLAVIILALPSLLLSVVVPNRLRVHHEQKQTRDRASLAHVTRHLGSVETVSDAMAFWRVAASCPSLHHPQPIPALHTVHRCSPANSGVSKTAINWVIASSASRGP